MFYHGFNNYMKYAYPEDELRPLSCRPAFRDRENPGHIEFNDAMGNYSLTLVDSLSTLAILASSSPRTWTGTNIALNHFQNGVRDLVKEYGDGGHGANRCGRRSCGFDLDSKVQVFETVIRGVGGLLSAHLFAVGDLPIRGYSPDVEAANAARTWNKTHLDGEITGIRWSNGFVYDGQLLRLAYDLGNRMLPAFWTATGIPYPRVNLRDGIPFYAKSPLNFDSWDGECDDNGDEKPSTECGPERLSDANPEITETCSAGAGSLVLEFTVLSRLTGDERFEDLGKRAFWQIWSRRTDVGLIGAGIDAETGIWRHPQTGIGAGIDSFFEYAFKAHILLSRDERPPTNVPVHSKDPRELFDALTDIEHSSEAFLQAWEEAFWAINRHFYRGKSYQHPHLIQADVYTGATRASWMDSLSAYFPGLLALAGELDEAIELHLLETALWTRYGALPERWNTQTGDVEGGLGWWSGRPEFAESNWYIYRATKDPWYLHVAEMVLRDIKRRCWTKCGWAGIQDVKTGELNDRMESFFLGETAKYLFLTFDPDHPLNHLDAPFVLTTEGHPLIIPTTAGKKRSRKDTQLRWFPEPQTQICPIPPSPGPLEASSTAARGDLFHAAALARLYEMPTRDFYRPTEVPQSLDRPTVSTSDLRSPSNYTYFPWTLPIELVPSNATSTPMDVRPTFDISFPNMPNLQLPYGPISRLKEGIMIHSVGGLRFALVQDMPIQEMGSFGKDGEGYRIQAINNIGLGRDEKVFLSREPSLSNLNPTDPNFTRVKNSGRLQIVLDAASDFTSKEFSSREKRHKTVVSKTDDTSAPIKGALDGFKEVFKDSLSSLFEETVNSLTNLLDHYTQNITRYYLGGTVAGGLGMAPTPDWPDAPAATTGVPEGDLQWSTIYDAEEGCDVKLPLSVPKEHQVIFMKRGGCTFSEKLENIPAFAPSHRSLQLVVVISEDLDEFYRPQLDRVQISKGGIPRRHPIPMVVVGGGEETYSNFQRAVGVGVKKHYTMEAQGVPIGNLIVV